MKIHHVPGTALGALLLLWSSAGTLLAADEPTTKECFESRKGVTQVRQVETEKGWHNVKCSATTGGVLFWVDPFDGTVPMGDMPLEGDYSHEDAVVKPREPQIDRNKLLTVCTMACHDGNYVPYPKDKLPRELKMHTDIVPDSLNLQHGRGAIWCLDCHHAANRRVLTDHFGGEISFNQPQKLCGKCHGQVYRSWRDGLHGKRIGMWTKGGKKRWWVCTECHDPHDVQQGDRNSGFARLEPELAPQLPKGMRNADHERDHGERH